jgi:malonyl-CoA decarboxylase
MNILNQILKFPARRRRNLSEVVWSLLRIKGEASAIKLAFEILQRYSESDAKARLGFFQFLADELGPDEAQLAAAISAFQTDPDPEHYLSLQRAVEPQRQDLIRILNWVPGGDAVGVLCVAGNSIRSGVCPCSRGGTNRAA